MSDAPQTSACSAGGGAMGGTSADYGAVQQTGQNRRPRLTAAPAEKGGGGVVVDTSPFHVCRNRQNTKHRAHGEGSVPVPCDSGPRYRKCRSGLPSWHAPVLFPEQGEGAEVRTAAATRFSTARRVRPAFRSLGKRMSGKDPERRYEQKEAVRMLSDSLFFGRAVRKEMHRLLLFAYLRAGRSRSSRSGAAHPFAA